ncbi:MAG: murein L,D-transpeptidase family protein [Pseudomonadota bacterium]
MALVSSRFNVQRWLLLGAIVLGLSGCAKLEVPAHLKPLSRDAMMLLGAKKMQSHAPIFIRIFKEESELEVWKQRPDGRFHHFKTYPICTWSGALGPKLKEGDKQAPEGFYTVNRHRMNPASSYHLAFNLGYPNAFDRAHGRTGKFLMVHGRCTSAGCYAMTDPLIEEIYALAREAFIGGQTAFAVHAFPFRMTPANMARHAKSKHMPFWSTLKPAYDLFERNRIPPPVAICERRYVVNAKSDRRLDPRGRCPRFETPVVTPYYSKAPEKRVVAPGPRKRTQLAGTRQAPGAATSPFSGYGLLRPFTQRLPSTGANKPAFSPEKFFSGRD